MGVLLLLILAGGKPAAGQASGNLLLNPGFEQGFFRWNGINEINVGHEWTPWWVEDPDHNPTWLRPEFKEGLARDFPYRVRSGERSQQWFKLFSSFAAGVYQQIFEVTPGQNYRFSIWAQVWSSTEDNPATVSTLPANPHLQVGIDPTGLWNPWSADVIWSSEALMDQVIDRYGLVSVEATAQNNIITVFVRAAPEFANKHNNIYLDDGAVVLVGPPPTSTPLPATNTPIASATLPATATSLPSDTPQPTNTPPVSETPAVTETPAPTVTLEPTATPLPSDTPVRSSTPLPATETSTPPATSAQAISEAESATVGEGGESEAPAEVAEEAEESGSGFSLCTAPLLGLLLAGVFVRRRRPK